MEKIDIVTLRLIKPRLMFLWSMVCIFHETSYISMDWNTDKPNIPVVCET